MIRRLVNVVEVRRADDCAACLDCTSAQVARDRRYALAERGGRLSPDRLALCAAHRRELVLVAP